MSTQDPYGTSDQPPRTGSSAAGSSSSGQPSWQQSAPAGPQQGHPAGPQQQAPYQDAPGQQGGYPAYPGQGGYDRPAPKNGIGLAALVLGILALVFSWTVFGGIILGLVAVILGIVGARRAKRGQATNRGVAITGLVLGVVGLLVGVAIAVAGAFFLSQTSDCTQLAAQGASEEQVQQCVADQLGVNS